MDPVTVVLPSREHVEMQLAVSRMAQKNIEARMADVLRQKTVIDANVAALETALKADAHD